MYGSYSFQCLLSLSLSHSICIFAGKWQLMRAKLEELQNDLITIENYDFGESLSLLQLSMAECHNLCPRCMDMFYNEKLLMHSDLDMAFAKLDMHTKKINEIYKTR